MSATAISSRRPSIQQRIKDAAAQLQRLLGASDLKLLSAAVTEAAAVEAAHNPVFRAQIQRIYADLSIKPEKTSGVHSKGPTHPELIPLPGSEGARFDPFAPLDPYALVRLYGPAQLHTALNGYSLATLREAASVVREKHPKSRPSDARKTESLIDYIVQHVTTLH